MVRWAIATTSANGLAICDQETDKIPTRRLPKCWPRRRFRDARVAAFVQSVTHACIGDRNSFRCIVVVGAVRDLECGLSCAIRCLPWQFA